jgi:hypothetical protein
MVATAYQHGPTTLADESDEDARQPKTPKGEQRESWNREGLEVVAGRVKTFQNASDSTKQNRWPVSKKQPES